MDNENSFETENLNENSSEGVPGKMKEYGKKSLAPLVELVHKYQADIVPYVTAIGRGLQASADALNVQGAESTSSEQAVGKWFGEAAGWFNGSLEKIQSGSATEFLDYLETIAKKNPSLMFSSSYIVGLVFGRMGKVVGKKMIEESFNGLKH